MNEPRFEELVNLYFDREISIAELECLKKELAARIDRRRDFQSRYRLHQATCSVLSDENLTMFEQFVPTTQTVHQRKYMSSIFSGIGIAACFLIVFATSIWVMRQPTDDSVNTIIVGTPDKSVKVRYLENQEQELPFQGSLSSQLRLAGLTPDISPSDQQLSTLDAEAIRQREAHLKDVIEKINRYNAYSAIPDQQLVKSFERTYERSLNNTWPADFKTSLASFK